MNNDDDTEGHNIVEGNYFYRCNTEMEVISIKSKRNTIRNNAFEDNQGFLTLRREHDQTIEGNVFVNYGGEHAGGIRVYAKNHVIRDNWIFGCVYGGVMLYDGDETSSHERASNITLDSNTFVDCQNAIKFNGGDPPITFRNNFVSNKDDMEMIYHHESDDREYDFSAGNYFFGENLGWRGDDQDLPEGMFWEEQAKDLGNEGLDRLERIKCKAGPSWEQTC